MALDVIISQSSPTPETPKPLRDHDRRGFGVSAPGRVGAWTRTGAST